LVDLKTPKSKNKFLWVNITPLLPLFCQEILKIHANINDLISALNVCKSPNFSTVMSDFRLEVEIQPENK